MQMLPFIIKILKSELMLKKAFIVVGGIQNLKDTNIIYVYTVYPQNFKITPPLK